MRRIVPYGVRTVGRSVGLMLEALSLEARTRGKDRRRKLSWSLPFSPLLPIWLSFFLALIALPF